MPALHAFAMISSNGFAATSSVASTAISALEAERAQLFGDASSTSRGMGVANYADSIVTVSGTLSGARCNRQFIPAHT
ncbi:hypothetical protein GCM10027057_26940 [Marisediminicola antarctica]|uniref:Uncharacterized protein n=2 Tax=Marisediminicola antarctica TaxID=674079 RepID=A0A7L5AER0_9MICO|nr:hypothetical protein BHD05_03710 [Marisediminicola antarctica]